MEISVGLRSRWPVRGSILIAQEAEKLGYHQVWINTSPLAMDPFLILNEIAKETSRIGLGTAIVNPYERHPIALTSSTLTLVEATHRKFDLGIGSSWKEWLAPYGINVKKPVDTVRQAVESVKKVVKERSPKLNEPPKVFVGAQGPKMLRMSGQVADGILSPKAIPSYNSFVIKSFLDGLNESGRPRNEVKIILLASMMISKDEEEAIKHIRPIIAEAIWHLSPAALLQLKLSRSDAEAIHHKPDLLSNDFVKDFAIVGDVSECRRQVKEIEGMGVDQLYLWYATNPAEVRVEDQVKSTLELIRSAADALL